jgi:hypothetical protein
MEFALVSLMMLMWIFGIMEVSRAFWTYQIIQEVAIQGARCMGILSTPCVAGNANTYMVGLASSLGMTLPAADIILSPSTACAGTPGFSKVEINYMFTTNLPMLIPSLSAVQLSASSCFVNAPPV